MRRSRGVFSKIFWTVHKGAHVYACIAKGSVQLGQLQTLVNGINVCKGV